MFRDENAELMKKLASGISAPVERFATVAGDLSKAGPIASQFFQQPEINIQHLGTEPLTEAMAGAEHAARWKFRQAMHAQYPDHPQMWDLTPPSESQRESRGHMSWPVPAKATSGRILSKSLATDAESDDRFSRLAQALARLEAVQALKACVDSGRISARDAALALAG